MSSAVSILQGELEKANKSLQDANKEVNWAENSLERAKKVREIQQEYVNELNSAIERLGVE